MCGIVTQSHKVKTQSVFIFFRKLIIVLRSHSVCRKMLFFSYEYYDTLFWYFIILCVVKAYFKTFTFQYS